MPSAPPKVCSGCGRAVAGKCSECSRKRHAEIDAHRPTSTGRGYDAAYRRIRLDALRRDGWTCKECGWKPDIVRRMARLNCDAPEQAILAELAARRNANEMHLHVDHRIPIEDAPELRLDLGNLQSLCSVCHSSKTMREVHARRLPNP